MTWSLRRGFIIAMLCVVLIATGCSSGGGTSSAPTSSSATTAGRTPGAAGDPGNASAGDPAAAGYTPTGTLIADDGFRPDKNGLPFANYGAQLSNGDTASELTADDVRKIFGDAVCVDLSTGKCDLTPEAGAWLTKQNMDVQGGHCYGFSAEAQLLWQQKQQSTTFGAPTVPELNIIGNTDLQRQLALEWASQLFPSTNAGAIPGTPNDILGKLKEVLVPNPTETYTVLIFMPDFSGGHAVTPYAIEDGGNGIFNLLIWDNNFQGVTRKIVFDTNANKWSYVASTNPNEPSALYSGDANTGTIFLKPTSPGQGVQPCPFCSKVPGAGGSAAPAAGGQPPGAVVASFKTQTPNPDTMDEIYLDGSDGNHGQLLITDENGKQTGFADGKFVNTIPGALIQQDTSSQTWREPAKPDYFVPDGHTYTVTIDGSKLTATDDTSVGIIGPSFELSVDSIQLNPGEKDTLIAAPDATKVTYNAARSETPKIEVAVSDDTADYTFDVSGVSDQPGSTVTFGLPLEKPSFIIDATGAQGTSTFDLTMTREDNQGKTTFGHDGITLGGGDMAELKFGDWANGQSIPLVTTQNGQQTTEQLTDQTP